MSTKLNLLLATRPAFLTITLMGCLIGLALPSVNKESIAINFLALILAVFTHAAANLLNDYFDHLNGSDQNNVDRIAPFTGGSRFIQNQVFKPRQILMLGITLILLSMGVGLYICSKTTWHLIPLGMIGLSIAWAYSAPPFELMSKGVLGELSISIAWSLVVIGFASIQKNAIAYEAVPIGLAYGLMVSNILLVNQIPDIRADQLAHKLTLAVKTSRNELGRWYLTVIVGSYALQMIGIHYFELPKATLITTLLLPIFLYCAKEISAEISEKEKIKRLILNNLVVIHLYALLLLFGLLGG